MDNKVSDIIDAWCNHEVHRYYIFWVCVCNLSYPTCNAHAPYCHLWPATLYNIFPHYLINGTILGEKSYWTQNFFWFPLWLLSETFLVLRAERDMIKNVYRASCKVPVIIVRFQWNMNLFYRFSGKSRVKISWKPVRWKPSSSMRTDWRTDGQTWRS